MKKVFTVAEITKVINRVKSGIILKSHPDLSAGHYTGISYEFEGFNNEMIERSVYVDNDGLYYRKETLGCNLKLKVSIETLVEILNSKSVIPSGRWLNDQIES